MKKGTKFLKVAALAAIAIFVGLLAAKNALADITIKNENENTLISNVSVDTTATATATGGDVYVNTDGSGYCSDCNGGATITATGGDATSSADTNTSVNQTQTSDSDVKIEVDTDDDHAYDSKSSKHYRRSDKKLPATGSESFILAGVALLALIAAGFATKKYFARAK